MQKDLEAQRTAVEQKYEKQSESVEKISGQIKSFKKDNDEYKKKVSLCACCPYACVDNGAMNSVC
jgi:hypothetical protein